MAEAEAAGDELFEQEDEFFDLATELEKELEDEEELEGEELLVAPEEQSLEEIVEGFKKGMAETLSAEDYDTHYNLGIAYREMGLIDEAIGEFQLAAKDARYLVDCCSLSGDVLSREGLSGAGGQMVQRGSWTRRRSPRTRRWVSGTSSAISTSRLAKRTRPDCSLSRSTASTPVTGMSVVGSKS